MSCRVVGETESKKKKKVVAQEKDVEDVSDVESSDDDLPSLKELLDNALKKKQMVERLRMHIVQKDVGDVSSGDDLPSLEILVSTKDGTLVVPLDKRSDVPRA